MGERGPHPGDALPQPLARLLNASDPSVADAAWQAFIAAYSALLLQVARSTGGDHDAAMDTYAFLLDQLREQNCRRLRVYAGNEGARFCARLVAITRTNDRAQIVHSVPITFPIAVACGVASSLQDMHAPLARMRDAVL
jgi:hypothetical protein